MRSQVLGLRIPIYLFGGDRTQSITIFIAFTGLLKESVALPKIKN